MKIKGFEIVLILLLFTIPLISAATHSSDDVWLKIDGATTQLSNVQTGPQSSQLRGTHSYEAIQSAVSSISKHDSSEVWIAVNGGYTTLLNALQTTKQLCPTKITSTQASAPNPSHLASEILFSDSTSLQSRIDAGILYCCDAEAECAKVSSTNNCNQLYKCGSPCPKKSCSSSSGESCGTDGNCHKCTPSWSCSDWGSCSGGVRTKTCTDTNNCGTTTGRPALTQDCTEATVPCPVAPSPNDIYCGIIQESPASCVGTPWTVTGTKACSTTSCTQPSESSITCGSTQSSPAGCFPSWTVTGTKDCQAYSCTQPNPNDIYCGVVQTSPEGCTGTPWTVTGTKACSTTSCTQPSESSITCGSTQSSPAGCFPSWTVTGTKCTTFLTTCNQDTGKCDSILPVSTSGCCSCNLDGTCTTGCALPGLSCSCISDCSTKSCLQLDRCGNICYSGSGCTITPSSCDVTPLASSIPCGEVRESIAGCPYWSVTGRGSNCGNKCSGTDSCGNTCSKTCGTDESCGADNLCHTVQTTSCAQRQTTTPCGAPVSGCPDKGTECSSGQTCTSSGCVSCTIPIANTINCGTTVTSPSGCSPSWSVPGTKPVCTSNQCENDGCGGKCPATNCPSTISKVCYSSGFGCCTPDCTTKLRNTQSTTACGTKIYDCGVLCGEGTKGCSNCLTTVPTASKIPCGTTVVQAKVLTGCTLEFSVRGTQCSSSGDLCKLGTSPSEDSCCTPLTSQDFACGTTGTDTCNNNNLVTQIAGKYCSSPSQKCIKHTTGILWWATEKTECVNKADVCSCASSTCSGQTCTDAYGTTCDGNEDCSSISYTVGQGNGCIRIYTDYYTYYCSPSTCSC